MIALYRALVPIALLALPVVALFSRKVRSGLRLRAAVRERSRFASAPFWIHAASGEFEYAKPLIRELRRRAPDVPIVVTYFSPTYAANVARCPGVAHSEPLPFDLPGPARAFLRDVRPRALLLARTDFWPEVLAQAGALKIPRVVFAYTQRPVAGLKAYVTRQLLGLVDEIFTVSDDDRRAVLALKPDARVAALGDPRYDQVASRLALGRALPDRLGDGPTLVAGSTWGPDEAVLLEATAALVRAGKLNLVVVPHEPAHVPPLERALRRHDLAFARWSEMAPGARAPVVIVDEVGWLADLYARADFALVGGSFSRSVHSVMEALGAGCVTFVGPRHANNREAVEFKRLSFEGQPALEVVAGADELRERLEIRLAGDRDGFREALLAEFARRCGATMRVAERVALDVPVTAEIENPLL